MKGKRVFDHLRDRLEAQAGIHDDMRPTAGAFRWTPEQMEQVKRVKWSARFEDLMRTYLLMGSLRYEKPQDALKGKFAGRPTRVQTNRMIDDLREYQITGNKEKLVDVANFCMIEFETSNHPKSHFQGTDRI